MEFNKYGDFEKSNLTTIELQKQLNTIKKKSNSKLLELLEKLKIDYCVLSMEDFRYFRVRISLNNNKDNYICTDIYFSNYDNCYIAKDYYNIIK